MGYSNYGTALAAYVVERVSGIPYPPYLETHILKPLEMRRTTSDQRLPLDLVPDLARGYLATDSGFQERPFDVYAFATAAGGQFATATDMARFTIAHLQHGQHGDARLLEADTAQRMHGTLFRSDQRLNGMAYGFMELDRNGQRIIGHIGSAVVTYSALALLPEENVGLFVAYNGDRARPLTVENATLGAFMDHFYPVSWPTLVPAADFAARSDELVGEYRRNNFGGSVTTAEKVSRIFGQSNRVIVAPGDGTLEVSVIAGTQRFVEVEPLYFREVGGPDALVFALDANGGVSHALFSGVPEYAYEKVAWYESPMLNQGFLLAMVGAFVTVPILTLVGWLRRRRGAGAGRSTLGRAAQVPLNGAAVLNLMFLAAFALELGDPALLWGDFTRLRLILIIPLVSGVLSIGAAGGAVVAWRQRLWSLPSRLHYTLGALAGLGFILFLSFWNLLGFRV